MVVDKCNFSWRKAVDTRLRCARRMESEVEITSVDNTQMNLAVTDKRELKGSTESREIFLKLEKNLVLFKY